MERKKRSSWVTYLDTTPKDTNMLFKVLGIGISELAIAYNPNVESAKWIIEDSARHDHTSNEKQASVTQNIYEDDPCYKFVEAGRDVLNYTTHILDIDRSRKNEDGSYYAELSDGLITITDFLGENADISYDLYYEGTKQVGSVTFIAGVPKFTPDGASSVD